jgi:hypothetical protein
MSITNTLDRWWYPRHADEWDALAFRRRVLEVLRPEHDVLDIGAGRGATPHMQFRGLARSIVGADVDAAVLQNPQLDRALHTPDGDLGELADASFDLIVCKDVLEHVADPTRFFAEVSRLLRPGGRFLAKTPGGMHYVTVIARVTPLWFHKAFNKMREGPRSTPSLRSIGPIRAGSSRAMQPGRDCSSSRRSARRGGPSICVSRPSPTSRAFCTRSSSTSPRSQRSRPPSTSRCESLCAEGLMPRPFVTSLFELCGISIAVG